MQPTLIQSLTRSRQIRGLLDHERRRPDLQPSRLLRLQALLLRVQRRLAELIEPPLPRAIPRPVPVPVRATLSGARTRTAI